MNIMQKIVTKIFKRDAEEQTRKWDVECSQCKRIVSLWDFGGVRLGGSGKKKFRAYCSSCDKKVWLKVFKNDNESRDKS